MAKSKLPDLTEIAHAAKKLATDLKDSISEIYKEYQAARMEEANEKKAPEQQPTQKTKSTSPREQHGTSNPKPANPPDTSTSAQKQTPPSPVQEKKAASSQSEGSDRQDIEE